MKMWWSCLDSQSGLTAAAAAHLLPRLYSLGLARTLLDSVQSLALVKGLGLSTGTGTGTARLTRIQSPAFSLAAQSPNFAANDILSWRHAATILFSDLHRSKTRRLHPSSTSRPHCSLRLFRLSIYAVRRGQFSFFDIIHHCFGYLTI
ncbi:hypothetical protein BDV18DRAFT_43818 [Aspergillus unguis]